MDSKRILIVVAVCLAAIFVFAPRQANNTLHVKNHIFLVEYARTQSEQAQGLSGRDSFADDRAMIFTFDSPNIRCFWMKDMKFSIDMVWLDESKRVNAVERDVSPQTYPSSFCHVNSQYVVEFTAGAANQLGLRPGDNFSF